MPFHVFGPPHLHVLPLVLSSALAFAAGAYYVARNGMPANVARLGTKFKARMHATCESRNGASNMFSRGSSSRNPTGNRAFDEYRATTLATLEQEGAEFRSYLDGLRHAKDKTEFDAFVSERRVRWTNTETGVTSEPLAP